MFLTLKTPATDLAKPSKEQLALQTELQRLQSARKLDAEESDNEKQVLQAQLQSEVSHVTAAEHEKVRGPLLHPHPTPDSPSIPRSLTSFCNSCFLVMSTSEFCLSVFPLNAPAGAAERSAQHRADGVQGEAAVADQAPGGHQGAAQPNSTRYLITGCAWSPC